MNNWVKCISNQCFDYWTIEAFDCYSRGCDCSKCRLPELLETLSPYSCSMKCVVLELVRRHGVPRKYEIYLNPRKEEDD